jgi:hypothetical protein
LAERGGDGRCNIGDPGTESPREPAIEDRLSGQIHRAVHGFNRLELYGIEDTTIVNRLNGIGDEEFNSHGHKL